MDKYNPINFTKSSTFIFGLRKKKYKSLTEEINDLNAFKPTINEIIFLKIILNNQK